MLNIQTIESCYGASRLPRCVKWRIPNETILVRISYRQFAFSVSDNPRHRQNNRIVGSIPKMNTTQRYNMLLCLASARTILMKLGVRRDQFPKTFTRDRDTELNSDEELAVAFQQHAIEHPMDENVKVVKRHRRTKKEMQQLREFEAWQKQQRSNNGQ
jgi:hypothetical protein